MCCETIISWDFGIEEGTFRRVSFGPATAVKQRDDESVWEDDKQPIWPGSWGTVINEFVVDLMFKVPSVEKSRTDDRYIRICRGRQVLSGVDMRDNV
jgi:hypothetical protein